MSSRQEILIGAAVLFVGGALITWVYNSNSSKAAVAGYELHAKFRHADGVSPGTDVRLAGLSVGQVARQELDNQYRAVLTLRIRPDVEIGDDTAAVIHTDGLMGGKYIELKPGASDDILKPGSQITYTQDSVMVQDLLEMIIGQAKAKNAQAKKDAAAKAKAAATSDQ